MSVKVLLAEILRNELTARGVNSLAPSDYDQIVERLVEQLTELELSLAAREITDKNEPWETGAGSGLSKIRTGRPPEACRPAHFIRATPTTHRETARGDRRQGRCR